MSGNESDSESLPDISEIITKPKTDISAGDIVWAKFKNLYWPALVRHIYSKEKKITIWYADEPGKTFKIPMKNVCLFHDKEMRMKIEKDVKEAGCVTEHDGLTSHASMYLRRKAEGYNDDPKKFFDQTYPFYLMEDLLKKNPNIDVNSIKIPHLYITPEEKLSRKKFVTKREASDDDASSIECVSSDESDSNPSNQPKDYLLKVKQKYSSVVVDCDKNTDEIVDFIKSGKADVHLNKIETKRISSMYSNIYEKSIKSNKKCISRLTYTGPIEDDEKLRELIFYLLDFHDKYLISNQKRKPSRSRSKKPKVMECTVSDEKSQNAQYVGSVLLPEAIIFAMSKIKKVTLVRAKQLFQKESESKTEALEKIIASLGSEETKNTSECCKLEKEDNIDENVAEEQDLQSSEVHDDKDLQTSSEVHDNKDLQTTSEVQDDKDIQTSSEVQDDKDLQTPSDVQDDKDIQTSSDVQDDKYLQTSSDVQNDQELHTSSEVQNDQELQTSSGIQDDQELKTSSEVQDDDSEATSPLKKLRVC